MNTRTIESELQLYGISTRVRTDGKAGRYVGMWNEKKTFDTSQVLLLRTPAAVIIADAHDADAADAADAVITGLEPYASE